MAFRLYFAPACPCTRLVLDVLTGALRSNDGLVSELLIRFIFERPGNVAALSADTQASSPSAPSPCTPRAPLLRGSACRFNAQDKQVCSRFWQALPGLMFCVGLTCLSCRYDYQLCTLMIME